MDLSSFIRSFHLLWRPELKCLKKGAPAKMIIESRSFFHRTFNTASHTLLVCLSSEPSCCLFHQRVMVPVWGKPGRLQRYEILPLHRQDGLTKHFNSLTTGFLLSDPLWCFFNTLVSDICFDSFCHGSALSPLYFYGQVTRVTGEEQMKREQRERG